MKLVGINFAGIPLADVEILLIVHADVMAVEKHGLVLHHHQ
jgi:hypothetical protein